MKESFYTLEETATAEEIRAALEEVCEDTASYTEVYGNLLHYDGNSLEAVFSEDRAYLRSENGASCLPDMTVQAFIQYESKHQLGSGYAETTRTSFQNHR
jgi:hypothetical protein